MNVYYNDTDFEVDDDLVEEIDYFDVKVPKVPYQEQELYWCPFKWSWRDIADHPVMEKRYKNSMKSVFFNDKIFMVEKRTIRKHFHEKNLVDVCLLPIGIYVYWNDAASCWDFLGYK